MDNFNVPMAVYNSAQVANLIGIYILDTLSGIVNLELMVLYQDDRIIFILESNSPKSSKIHKKIFGAFNLLRLWIEIALN